MAETGKKKTQADVVAECTAEAVAAIRKANAAIIRMVVLAKTQDDIAAAYIKVYTAVRDTQDDISEAIKPIAEVVAEFADYRLPEAFEAAGIKTLTLESGDRVTIMEKLIASIKAGMKDDAIKFFKKSKKTKDMVQETINSSTLSAYAKSLAEQGMSLPDDLFNIHIKSTTSLTRSKKKAK